VLDINFPMCVPVPVTEPCGRVVSLSPAVTGNAVMAAAVARWLLQCDGKDTDLLVKSMRSMYYAHPLAMYPPELRAWLRGDAPICRIYGAGAAVLAALSGFWAATPQEAREVALRLALLTHAGTEALLAARLSAQAAWMLSHGSALEEVLSEMTRFGLDFSVADEELKMDLRRVAREDVMVNGTVIGTYYRRRRRKGKDPALAVLNAAIRSLAVSRGYESAVRAAVTFGGPGTDIPALAGAFASALYGAVPSHIRAMCRPFIPNDLRAESMQFTAALRRRPGGRRQEDAEAAMHPDAFRVIRALGVRPVYVVDPGRNELVTALRNTFGREARVVAPEEAAAVLSTLSGPHRVGTYVDDVHLDVETMYFQDGEFRTPATYVSDGIPGYAERSRAQDDFWDLSRRARRIRQDLQRSHGYTGRGDICYETAAYPVVYQFRVEVRVRGEVACTARIDARTGLLDGAEEVGRALDDILTEENVRQAAQDALSLQGLENLA
jgi:ADP-ribosylglycohydrolase